MLHSSPPKSSPPDIAMNPIGGLETLMYTGEEPAFYSPPICLARQRTWEPYAPRVLARREFATSSDVSPLRRATRLRHFDHVFLYQLNIHTNRQSLRRF